MVKFLKMWCSTTLHTPLLLRPTFFSPRKYLRYAISRPLVRYGIRELVRMDPWSACWIVFGDGRRGFGVGDFDVGIWMGAFLA